jgi:hypothetical protein
VVFFCTAYQNGFMLAYGEKRFLSGNLSIDVYRATSLQE